MTFDTNARWGRDPEGWVPSPEEEAEMEEVKRLVRERRLRAKRGTPDRWHPPTFATPIHSLPGIEEVQ